MRKFMKLNKKLFVLAGLTLLGGLVTGCSDVSYNSDGIVQIKGDVYTISATEKTLSYAEINKAVNLDDYYQVVMDDENSTIRHEFTITCEDESVKIDGHNVTGTKLGDYQLKLAVNDKDKYINFSVRSAYNIELIKFFDKFQESDGKNYRIDLGEYDEGTKEWEYGNYTILHNQDYVVIFDADDPGAVDEDGYADSTILATLSDGNAYWGSFDEEGMPVFENGKTRLDKYYIGGSMILDGSSFTSITDDVTKEEMLVGGKKQVQTFLSYGMSSFPENNGYTSNGFYVLGLTDEDKDGTTDTLYARITVDGPSADDKTTITKDQEWCTVKISEVGSCTWSSVEAAIKDEKYVPKKLDSSEIVTAFEKLAEGNNYTTTFQIYACDSSGKALTFTDEELEDEATLSKNVMYALFGTVSTFTEIHTVTSATDIECVAYIGDEEEPYASQAYWKGDDGKCYVGTYTAKTAESAAKTTKDEDTNGKYLEAMKTYRVDNVDTDTIADVDWTKRVSQGTKVAWTGSIGDNVDGVQTNGFFAGLFDQMFSLDSFGTFMTKDGSVEYNDGSTCSYTFSSTYSAVMVDTATNQIIVNALIALPFSNIEQPYFMCTYTVSNIGETTNDFSFYADATASLAD